MLKLLVLLLVLSAGFVGGVVATHNCETLHETSTKLDCSLVTKAESANTKFWKLFGEEKP